MKLIELLVQEGKKGNFSWPNGYEYIAQDSADSSFAGNVYAYEKRPNNLGKYWGDVGNSGFGAPIFRKAEIAEDCFDDIVTREQYEAALAAAQQPVWDGEGIPTVGCECEYLTNLNGPRRIKIECVTKDGVAFTWMDNDKHFTGLDCIGTASALEHIRPIRSEADKKRDEAESTLRTCLAGTSAGITPLAAKYLYDAIAAGKIPGIRIE